MFNHEQEMESMKVCKFGGSSVADAVQVTKVCDIMLADPQRRIVVVSAPGKRSKADTKVTDMLYQCHRMVERNQSHEEMYHRIIERYMEIYERLGLDFDFYGLLLETGDQIRRLKNPDFAASRGEYLNGVLLSRFLGWDFIDAKDVIKFDRTGVFASEWTNEVLRV